MINLNDLATTIMTSVVTTVNPSQKLVDVKHIFEKKNFHHHIPVIEEGKIVGMISLTDYMHAIKDASLDDDEPIYNTLNVRDVMSEDPVLKPSNTTIKEIAKELADGYVHAILIADNHQLNGIVTTADIIRYFLANAG